MRTVAPWVTPTSARYAVCGRVPVVRAARQSPRTAMTVGPASRLPAPARCLRLWCRSAGGRRRRPATSSFAERPMRTSATIDLQIVRRDVVGVRPLADDAVRLEARARRLEEFAREQRGDARHPGIRRLRHDDVVLPGGEQQMRPAVADDQTRRPVGRARGRFLCRKNRRLRPLQVKSRRRRRARTVPGAKRRGRRDAAAEADDRDVLARCRAEAPAAGRAAAASACRPRSTRRPCRRSPATACRPGRAR